MLDSTYIEAPEDRKSGEILPNWSHSRRAWRKCWMSAQGFLHTACHDIHRPL